jgi:hypothetical protein
VDADPQEERVSRARRRPPRPRSTAAAGALDVPRQSPAAAGANSEEEERRRESGARVAFAGGRDGGEREEAPRAHVVDRGANERERAERGVRMPQPPSARHDRNAVTDMATPRNTANAANGT